MLAGAAAALCGLQVSMVGWATYAARTQLRFLNCTAVMLLLILLCQQQQPAASMGGSASSTGSRQETKHGPPPNSVCDSACSALLSALLLMLLPACCRFGPLASFNGRPVSSEEVAAAGALFSGLEATLDPALVRPRLGKGPCWARGITNMLAVRCLIALVRRWLGALTCLLAVRCLNATVTAANTVGS